MSARSWRRAAGIVVLALILPAGPVRAGTDGGRGEAATRQALAALRMADLRLATLVFRLATANAPLCDRQRADTGLVLHVRDQYDAGIADVVADMFGLSDAIGVEGVVPDSPAAAAGVRAGDRIVTIDGVGRVPADAAVLAIAQRQLDQVPAGRRIAIGLTRNGAPTTGSIQPVIACAVHAEVRVTRSLNAASDGDRIQVDSAMMNLIGDDGELAALVAHELAHAVLHHRERLEAAGISRGLFGRFGRSARLMRQTEIEADRLSVALLWNAGFDPFAAARLWRDHRGQLSDGGMLGGATHLRFGPRIALLEREARAIAARDQRPIVPPLVGERSKPLR